MKFFFEFITAMLVSLFLILSGQYVIKFLMSSINLFEFIVNSSILYGFMVTASCMLKILLEND